MKKPIKINLDQNHKTPILIPLTNNPRSKEPKKIPLESNNTLDIEHEKDYSKNHSEILSELASNQRD
jgi:hypothetical protein